MTDRCTNNYAADCGKISPEMFHFWVRVAPWAVAVGPNLSDYSCFRSVAMLALCCQYYHQGNDGYTRHLIVQRLNSFGASYMEQGEYEKAIAVLVKALKMWETIREDVAHSPSDYSIDECIAKGRHILPRTASCHRHKDDQQHTNDNWPQHSSCSGGCCASMEEEQGGYIYRQPIFTTPAPSVDNDCLRRDYAAPSGTTLSIIIILNLAMAHHLAALENNTCHRDLQRALQLYELVHQMQVAEEIGSPPTTMIITNNVGEIHRVAKNDSKHIICLQHLLSTMMYVVDNHCTPNTLEWDGFLRNVSQLILHNKCASAA